LATFYSRSRKERWCKGETSGAFLGVSSVHADCDGDSLVYLSTPAGPACHTGAPSCWFAGAAVAGEGGGVDPLPAGRRAAPLSTLLALERTIAARKASPPAPGSAPSWTARLLADPALAGAKVREEAGELADAVAGAEGAARVASEAADLLYHALALLATAGVTLADVAAVLRAREGVSGVTEKAARAAKA
jgi:phosphoribosyl-ATP pyrophosphohydrolase/phosphoribosyl-AMP cyclohydrolase